MSKINIPVEEYTSPSPLQVEPGVTLEKVVALMSDHAVRHIPVVQDDKAVGILSERDLALLTRHAHADRVLAGDVMTPNPYCVTQDTPLDQVAFTLSQNKIGSAVVTDDEDNIIGIFTVTDALNALIEILRGNLDDGSYEVYAGEAGA